MMRRKPWNICDGYLDADRRDPPEWKSGQRVAENRISRVPGSSVQANRLEVEQNRLRRLFHADTETILFQKIQQFEIPLPV